MWINIGTWDLGCSIVVEALFVRGCCVLKGLSLCKDGGTRLRMQCSSQVLGLSICMKIGTMPLGCSIIEESVMGLASVGPEYSDQTSVLKEVWWLLPERLSQWT